MNAHETHRPGDLTVSGLLYEGSDFNSWAESTCAVLRVRNLMPADLTFDALMALDWSSMSRKIPKREEARGVLFSRTSPHVLQRNPTRFDTQDIFKTLKEASKPFRLMDLPPELRNRVYQAALDHVSPDQEVSITGPRRAKIPPLLQVSRGTRAETRTLYFGTMTFKVEHVKSKTDPVKTQIDEWMNKIVRSDARHLRSLITTFSPCPSRPGSRLQQPRLRFFLRWSPTNGLRVGYTGNFEADAELRMKKLAVKAIDMAKTMHLRGEGIVLAILVLDSFWTFRAVGPE